MLTFYFFHKCLLQPEPPGCFLMASLCPVSQTRHLATVCRLLPLAPPHLEWLLIPSLWSPPCFPSREPSPMHTFVGLLVCLPRTGTDQSEGHPGNSEDQWAGGSEESQADGLVPQSLGCLSVRLALGALGYLCVRTSGPLGQESSVSVSPDLALDPSLGLKELG